MAPHVIVPHAHLYSDVLPECLHEPMEYVIETVYIFASCLFVAGTLFFFPGGFGGLDEKISTGVGCRLYDVGSLVFALMSVYALAEMRYVQWYGLAKVFRHRDELVMKEANE